MELKNERNVDDDLEGMEKNELFDFVHWQRKEKEISWMVQKQAAMEGHTDSRFLYRGMKMANRLCINLQDLCQSV
ncbi:hypothetical protein Tco_0077136 [Tanacetum coccineum]